MGGGPYGVDCKPSVDPVGEGSKPARADGSVYYDLAVTGTLFPLPIFLFSPNPLLCFWNIGVSSFHRGRYVLTRGKRPLLAIRFQLFQEFLIFLIGPIEGKLFLGIVFWFVSHEAVSDVIVKPS